MTPASWTFGHIVALVIGSLFGSLLLVWVPLGFAIGRIKRNVELAIGCAALGWGLCNLVAVSVLALYVEFDTVVRELPQADCVLDPASASRKYAIKTYRLDRPSLEPLLVRTPSAAGGCSGALGKEWLRLRKDQLASTAAVIEAEEADDGPLALGVTAGLFGLAGVLMGSLLLAHRKLATPRAAAANRPPLHKPAKEPPTGWRRDVGNLIGYLGTLLLLAAFIAPWFIAGPAERGIAFGLLCASSAFFTWIVGALIAGTMNGVAFVVMLIFGAVLLLFSQLVRHMA